jgi:N utilization substance protein B
MQESLELLPQNYKRASDRLLTSEPCRRCTNCQKHVEQAIALAQTAINRVATVQELPEMIQLADRPDSMFADTLCKSSAQSTNTAMKSINTGASLIDWQLNRLARIDRDILRIAVAEIEYLGFKDSVSVAINEAVELAKRYSEEEGYKFINGVLRRVMSKKRRELLK